MGSFREPQRSQLVIGLLGRHDDDLARARERLLPIFGSEEDALAPIDFAWTNYYEDELGSSPRRSFLSYQTLIPRESLVEIKHQTNSLEDELAHGGLRTVNLDPGCLTLGQFFLATTKDQRQRVYLGRGVFMEPTLYFEAGAFHPFPWTYPDYRSPAYHGWLTGTRARLARRLARAPSTP